MLPEKIMPHSLLYWPVSLVELTVPESTDQLYQLLGINSK